MPRQNIRSLISASRKEEITDLAEEVAADYLPNGKVDPLIIAKDKKITTSFNYYGDSFDGMLEHKHGRFHIYCNLDRIEQKHSVRARFTLGHELGHYFIDEHRNALASGKTPAHGSKCEYESDLLVEREADLFASHLLMPKTQFLELARRGKVGLDSIRQLASEFGTSITSTALRYASLDLVPCAVVKWNEDGLQWKWLSTETFKARFRKTIDAIAHLPEDCPTKKALNGTPVPMQGYFEAGTTAAAWFPFISEDNYRNVIFMEQAIPLGRFGVLSFIYPDEETYSFMKEK